MKIEILANRTKFIAAAFFAVLLTILGVLTAFFPENFNWLPLGDHYKLVVGLTIALIFAVVCVFSLIKLKENKVAVTIDEAGITDHIGGITIGHIPWETITGFGVKSQLGNKFIVIFINNVDEVMAAQPKLKRRLLQEHVTTFKSPAAIGCSMLQGGYDKLREVLEVEGAKREVHFKVN